VNPKKNIAKINQEKVIIFPTCFVNYNNPDLGLLAKKILDKLGVHNEFFYSGCCGMPQLEGGDIESVSQKASDISSKLKNFIDDGYTVLSIVPSCTLMLKFEWPLLLPENKDVKQLSQKTKDVCEFLTKIITDNNKDLLKPLDGENNISLHISCHSRAQNIGQKATELLKLIPQLKLDVIERCSGHGGSWGIKKNNFEMAIKVGKPVARKVIQFENEYVVSECPLAGTHIQQGVNKIDNSKNIKVLSHPLEVLAKSMSIK